MHTPAMARSALDTARAQLAGFLATPLIQAAERAWHPSQLTEQQQRARASQEAAMRRGDLRGLPSCFGDLA